MPKATKSISLDIGHNRLWCKCVHDFEQMFHYSDVDAFLSTNIGTDQPVRSASVLPGDGGRRERTRLLPAQQQRHGSVCRSLVEVSPRAITHVGVLARKKKS